MINAAERLSKRVRAAMGDHNNDDLPVTQCVINMRKEVVSLQSECGRLAEALEAARQFIVNGIEVGAVRMPDSDTPDPAHNTLPMIDAALAAYRKGGDV